MPWLELDRIAAPAEFLVEGVAEHEPVDAAIGHFVCAPAPEFCRIDERVGVPVLSAGGFVSAACRAASMFVPKLTTNSKQIAMAVSGSSAARCSGGLAPSSVCPCRR